MGIDVGHSAILVTKNAINLFVHGIYDEVARRSAGNKIKVYELDDLEKHVRKCRSVGIESEHMTLAEFSRMKRKYKSTRFVQKKGVIEYFRRQKGEDEIKKFKKAQRITREMIRRVPSALKSRPTEKQLAEKLLGWAKELGADGLSFDPIVAFGTNTSCPHHRATNRKLKKGHIVQIDVGAKYKGYCSDQSRVFFTAKPTALQSEVLKAVTLAKRKSTAAVKPGVSSRKLDQVATKVLKEFGFEEYFIHSLGHGVGLEIHESVSISSKGKSEKLLKNEIITIEPGVYIPGKFGIRLEDEIVVNN